MATDKTVATETLRKLGVVNGSGKPPAEPVERALGVLTSRVDALRELEVVWWTADSIPVFMEDPLAEYLTFYVAPLFFDEQAAQSYALRSEKGLADIRRLAAKSAQGATVKAEYF